MPASTDANRNNSKAAVLARLDKYDSTPANKKESPEDLPRWVKTALIHWAVEGTSWNETAKKFGKAGSTLANYAKSPAAKEWLGVLDDFLDDPVAQAKAILGTNALGITVDRLLFLDMAKAAGDYAAGDKIAKDLQEKIGIVSKKSGADGALSVNISLASSSVEIPSIEAEWEMVGDEEASE